MNQQLVTSHRLLYTATEILMLFSKRCNEMIQEERSMKSEKQKQEFERTLNDKLSYGVNEIIKNVSPDRAYVISVLDYLKNCNLIKEDNNNWSIGTKKKIKPTLLGLEVVDIIDNMDKYRAQVRKLLDAYGKHVDYFLNKYKNKNADIIKKKSRGEKVGWNDLLDYDSVLVHNGRLRQKEAKKYHDFENTIQSALYHLEVNELPALISAYPRIYYSYKKQMTEETAEFLRNVIAKEIDKQLKIWVQTNGSGPLEFNKSNEAVVDDYSFRRTFSGQLVQNLKNVYREYALDADDKFGLIIDDAIVSLFQISKPLDEGGRFYLDPEKRHKIEPSDLAVLKNMSKHKDGNNKAVRVRKEKGKEEDNDFDFDFLRLMSQFEYYQDIEGARSKFRSEHFN
jgi:hypothetical protein